MTRPVVCLSALGLIAALFGSSAIASETWNFELATSGQDVFYTSPTAVCPGADEYQADYILDYIEVTVSYIGITFGPFEITDQIPPELRSGSVLGPGPAPVVFVDQAIAAPPPPDPVAVAGTLRIELDGSGFGHASFTDVTLGTTTINLGFPFGTVTVQIESLLAAGSVTVTELITGDVDGDLDVDLSDLTVLLAAYGTLSGATRADGDFDGDGDVDLTDLATLISNFGRVCS